MRVVVVSPHRDDAAFSLGLAIEHWLATGHRVDVLNCFTQSEYAPFSDVDTLHANDRRSFVSAVRRREDVAWGKLLGGKVHITDLELLDAPLRLSCAAEEVLTLEIRPGDRALARVAGSLRKMATKAKPNELALVIPLAVGGHIDHRIVREAALEALAESAIPVAFYEDLPYTARAGAAESVSDLAATTGLGLQPAFTQPAGDLDGRVSRKYKFAQCYDSQIDTDVARHIADFANTYGGRERLWSNQAWRDSLLHVPSDEVAA